MKKLIILALAAIVGALSFAPVATASPQDIRVMCNTSDSDGYTISTARTKPYNCAIWRDGWAHYQSSNTTHTRWTHWGQKIAYGHGIYRYNMGFRSPVHVKLWRPRFMCGNHDFKVYTRVSMKVSKGGNRWHTSIPDTCEY